MTTESRPCVSDVRRRQRRTRRAANAVALTLFVLLLLWLRGHMLSVAEGIIDAEAYWRTEVGPELYSTAPGVDGAFLYSPLVAQLHAPFTALPYEAFHALLMAVNAAALLWMLGPVLALASMAFPPVMLELAVGNVHLLIAAALVASVRRNSGWLWYPLLTKVTPGLTAVLYNVLRRDWERTRWSLGVTLGLVTVSAAIAPDLWVAWIELVLAGDRSNVSTSAEFLFVPFAIRIAASAIILGVAAWKQWPVLLPLAALLSLPFVWDHSLSLLVATWPLWVHQRREMLARAEFV